MQAHRLLLATVGLSLALLVALAAWAVLPATLADPTEAVTVHDGSSTSMATPTPPTSLRVHLQPIMKSGPSDFELEVWNLVNQQRAAGGLPPLNWSNELWCAARSLSVDMATNNCFSHNGCQGNYPFWERSARCGYQMATGGENIAAGFSTPASVVQTWMASSGHRANILNPSFLDLGVGYAYNQSSTYHHYWTLDLATRSGQSSATIVSLPEPISTAPATPTPTATPTTICATTTPEPLLVEPVTSPTDQLSQVVTVRIGNGQAVTVTAESGTFAATGNFSAYMHPALVTVTLLPNITHHLQVFGQVKLITDNGCTYGGYVLSTTRDRFGAPLTIVQQSGSATPTPTASPVPTGDLGWQSIYGTVRGASATTPVPLAAAVVSYTHFARLGGGNSGSTTTGVDGRYSFAPIYLHDTDDVTVRAAATGYATQEQQRSGLQTWYNPVFDFLLTPWTPTPTPTMRAVVYLPLIMKGWLTWLPGTPTLMPTPTSSATPTNTPMPTSTATPTPLPARLEIASLICEGADERVAITNLDGQAQVMTDWRIHSVVGPQWYDFPYGYTLAAGATVHVHSGPEAINNPPSDLLWTYRYIWNDDGDEAVLEDPTGQVVDNLCCAAGCRP